VDSMLQTNLIALARSVAEEHGWVWREPADISSEIHEEDSVWIVRSNAMMRSPSIRVWIRKSDLAVVHAGYLPR
jgi:hypothetical protein